MNSKAGIMCSGSCGTTVKATGTEMLHDNNGLTELGMAVRDGDMEQVTRLIQAASDVNAVDFYDRSPLHHAAEKGDADLVKLIINNGGLIDLQCGFGISALHIAACNGSIAIAQLLIDSGCNVNIHSTEGFSPIHCATANGHMDILKAIISAGGNCNLIGPIGRTALCIAAECGYTEIVRALSLGGAKLNMANDYGMTALCDAVMNKNTETARLLIRMGSRVNKADNKHSLPLHYAVRNGDVQLVQDLLQAGSQVDILNKTFESPAHIAVRTGHVDVLKLLVKHGCDVNHCESFGNVTPLHVAINAHHSKPLFSSLLSVLLDGGCLLNVRAFSTLETPLYRAIDLNKSSIAEILIKHGADPHLASPFDVTALLKACQRENERVVELLLHSGIDIRKERWIYSGQHGSSWTSHSDGIRELLRTWVFNVVPMQALCRTSIRKHLGELLERKVTKLPLPNRIKDYLMMVDV